MKIKGLLIGMLACTALVGCTSDDVVENNEQEKYGDAYLAVNIVTPNAASRAVEGGVYEEGTTAENGTADENQVTDARFYFFDASKNAFAVKGTANYATATSEELGKNMNNIEQILKAVIVIENHQGALPKYMVAVLNTGNALGTGALSFDQLKARVGTIAEYGSATTGKFVMSSSVYMDANKEDATTVTLAANNIQLTANDAMQNPVNIYVERVLAKVRVNTDASYQVKDKDGENVTFDGKNVKAVVKGWRIVDYTDKSYLIKNIETTWTDANLGFVWNDAEWKRSYWAKTTTEAQVVDPNDSYDEIKMLGNPQYCFENTLGNNNTKVMVAAELQDENGNPLTITEWLGEQYTLDGLKNAIANVLAADLYTMTEVEGGKKWDAIKPEAISFKKADDTGAKDYQSEAIPAFADGDYKVGGVQYYAKGSTTAYTLEEVKAFFEKVQLAKIWNTGMTYYYQDIKHLGQATKTGEYGIVRNHIYDFNISGITGLGTPVYKGDEEIIKDKPTTDESFVAAQVYILSWRVVANDDVILE